MNSLRQVGVAYLSIMGLLTKANSNLTRVTRRLGFEVVRAYPQKELDFNSLDSGLVNHPQNYCDAFWISFSLYGSKSLYSQGLIAALRSYHQLFPGWRPIVFTGDSVDQHDLYTIKSETGALIVPMRDYPENSSAMLWRYLAVNLVSGRAVIFRDADSRATPRERSAIDEWLALGSDAHIMRDHENHTLPIMGGMWGLRLPSKLEMNNLISDYGPDHEFSGDQRFLRSVIYPLISKSCLVHSDVVRFHDSPSVITKPFPIAHQDNQYVGRGFNPDGSPRPGH